MSITFACECGKILRAGDELAGKKTRCPNCQAVLPIPEAEEIAAALDPEPDPGPEPSEMYMLAEETPPPPGPTMTFRPRPQVEESRDRTPTKPAAKASAGSNSKSRDDGASSLLEYSYLLLAFALIPLLISLTSPDANLELQDRFARTIANASSEDQARMETVFSRGELSLEEALAALPGGKLDGAHLARDTSIHWAYAAIAAAAFLLLLGLLFSVERAHPMHLLGIGAFTGTVGIIFLLLVQFCSNFRIGHIRGQGLGDARHGDPRLHRLVVQLGE